MRLSEVPLDAVQEYAVKERVCIRPLLRRVMDRETGEAALVALPCQSTRESRCPSCAARARACECTNARPAGTRGGAQHPRRPERASAERGADDRRHQRSNRSTRRRSDVADLPRRSQEDRTIGQVFHGRDGRRPGPRCSSRSPPRLRKDHPWHGHTAELARVRLPPRSPRRPALPAALDRWFQNLRRCAGYKVQCFGAVEGQRRLARHFHVAIRGGIPRAVIKEVTRATYQQIWWPQMSSPVYVDQLPEWDGVDYLDPSTGVPLQTWVDARRSWRMTRGAACARDPVRPPDRRAGTARRHSQRRSVGPLPHQVPDQGGRRDVRRRGPGPGTRRTWTGSTTKSGGFRAHRTAQTGSASVSNRGRLARGWCRAGASARHTTGSIWGSVVVRSCTRGQVPGRHWPVKGRPGRVVREEVEAAGIEVESARGMAAEVEAGDGGERFVWAAVVLCRPGNVFHCPHGDGSASGAAGGSGTRRHESLAGGLIPLWTVVGQLQQLYPEGKRG